MLSKALRRAGKARDDSIRLMDNSGLPLPTQDSRKSCSPTRRLFDDDALKFPSRARLNEVLQLTPVDVQALESGPAGPVFVDVREPGEYIGQLGHIKGSRLIPLRDLAHRAHELAPFKREPLVAVCRSGVRSMTAAAILASLGFERVYNLKGGMIAWNGAGLPVERGE